MALWTHIARAQPKKGRKIVAASLLNCKVFHEDFLSKILIFKLILLLNLVVSFPCFFYLIFSLQNQYPVLIFWPFFLKMETIDSIQQSMLRVRSIEAVIYR